MKYGEYQAETKSFLAKNLNFNDKKINLIEIFVEEVLNYNQKYNLISRSSEKDIWNRHVMDSAQLIKHIDHNNFNSLADLGTGAGFPGIILSIFYSDILTFHVKLYEKSKVKSNFLKGVVEKLGLRNTSIYDNDYQYHELDSGYIVCRAFKKLSEVLRISRETTKKPHKLIVMLGKNAQEELNKASKDSINKYKLVTSITSSDSKIFLLNANE